MSEKELEDGPKVIDLQALREKRTRLPEGCLQEALDNVHEHMRRSGARVDSFAVVVVLDDGKVYRDWGWSADQGGLLHAALEKLKLNIMEQLFGDGD